MGDFDGPDLLKALFQREADNLSYRVQYTESMGWQVISVIEVNPLFAYEDRAVSVDVAGYLREII